MRNVIRRVLVALVIVVVIGSVSFNTARSFELVDQAGKPADLAYVSYAYVGSRPNFVHPVSYEATKLALTRSDSTGRVALRARFHVHKPFPIETHPSLKIELVYVPRLHNALVQINEAVPSRPGLFEIDAERSRAIVSDLSANPQLWEGTLRNLEWHISRLVSRRPGEASLRETDAATAALTRELIGHFREEYDAFLVRYRDHLRQRPEMPETVRYSTAEEQRRWKEMVDADFAQAPTWGLLIERTFGDDLRYLSRLESGLQ